MQISVLIVHDRRSFIVRLLDNRFKELRVIGQEWLGFLNPLQTVFIGPLTSRGVFGSGKGDQ